ncbi:MAG: hypothetical protein HQL66_03105 [Magnetococcales bacterium]|nr:hypothetical protein [Magnetococcales bacterium]
MSIRLKVRARLMEKGESLYSWARIKGYNPRVVNRSLQVYADGTKRPRGKVITRILTDLSRDTGVRIIKEEGEE